MTDQRWEHQRRTFERTAHDYDRYRPTYPDAAFDDLHAYAALEAPDRILEIGCGTGQATTALARWGNPILAIDPSEAMIEVAQRNLADRSHVELRVARFEELHDTDFGLLLSAQAFHWLDPETRFARCAAALRPGGTLALLWNTQVTPPEKLAFFERVQHVYLEHAPAIAHKGEFKADATDDAQLDALAESGLFGEGRAFRYRWHWTLARDDYVGLMSTHSPQAALPDDQRARLLDGIAELIDAEFDGEVTEHYVTELFVCRTI